MVGMTKLKSPSEAQVVGLNTGRGPEFRSHRLRHAGQHCASGCDSWVKTPGRAWTGLTVYDSSPALGFAADAAAVEITLANGGRGPRGPADAFGRCSSRYHEMGCAHDQSVDWMAAEGGPPRSTYDASLSNWATGLAIDLAPRSVWDDPDDYDQAPVYMPAHTVELASSLADEWGLHGDAWAVPSATDLLRAPGAPVSMQDALLQDMGYELQPQQQPTRPGIRQLAEDLGLR